MKALPSHKKEKKTKNILSFRKKVRSYLEKNDFRILKAKGNSMSNLKLEITLDDTYDFKHHFAIAKEEGINTIIEETKIFTEDDYFFFGFLDNELDSRKKKFLKKIRSDRGIVSGVSYYWIKDNIRYLFSKKTFQFKEARELFYSNNEPKIKKDAKNVLYL